VQASAVAVLKNRTKYDSSYVMIQKRSAFMVKWYSGKRKWYLAIAVAVIAVSAVVLALVINQELISKHMYPQDTIHENSNVSVRGIVTSIEQNHRSDGFGIDCYHIFRFYIRLNITEIVWISEDFADSSLFSTGSDTICGSNMVGIGYDNLDDPQLSVGQIVECKGYYLPLLDSPHSSMITVAPSVSDSYFEAQV